MRIAILQPPYPAEATKASAEECINWMRTRLGELKPGEQDIVLLPEYANTPGLDDPNILREFAESSGEDFLRDIAGHAERLKSLIVLAAVIKSGVRYFNRTLVFNAEGNLVFTYDKVHLTAVEKENLGLTSGSMPALFEHGGVKIGFATCFDLYFAEHFAVLAAQRADLILCPSYQRSESADRIRMIAQARSLDSGAYLIRSSYAMGEPDRGGRSLAAAPDGTLVEDAGDSTCVISADIDPHRKFTKPAFHGQPAVEHRSLIESHRRVSIYRPHWERIQQLAGFPFPRLCAHQGLSKVCPENTLPAFAAAIASGAHEIEFDLRTSCDGIPVVCHDETVDRTTNGSGKVNELAWDDICSLDAGIHSGEAWRGVRMPRVEEVLELTDGLAGLNIHIKEAGPDGSTIKRVCDLLSEYGLTDIAYLSMDTELSLKIAHEYAPEIPRSCLIRQDDPLNSIAIAKQWSCQRIQFFRQVTKEQISRAHEAGLICNLFWSDDPEDAMQYVANGIDVILTNCTHIMAAGTGIGTRNRLDKKRKKPSRHPAEP